MLGRRARVRPLPRTGDAASVTLALGTAYEWARLASQEGTL